METFGLIVSWVLAVLLVLVGAVAPSNDDNPNEASSRAGWIFGIMMCGGIWWIVHLINR